MVMIGEDAEEMEDMRKVARAAAAGALLVVVMSQGMAAASAANPKSSCVGLIVSTLAPTGELDVDNFKALAESMGVSPFGAFVAEGAHFHEGTFERCLP